LVSFFLSPHKVTSHVLLKFVKNKYWIELNWSICRSTAERQISINGRNKQKCLLYSRSVEKQGNEVCNNYLRENMCELRNVNIMVYTTQANTYTDTDVKFYKKWPGLSPTVNISWFVAKAHLANLYYVTQRDFRLTIQTCDDVVDVYEQSNMNQILLRNHFLWFCQHNGLVSMTKKYKNCWDFILYVRLC